MTRNVFKHMKRGLLAVLILAAQAPGIAETGSGSIAGYTRLYLKKDGFSILIPDNWKKTSAELSDRTVILLKKGEQSEISISSAKATENELKKWETWRQWYLKNRGFRHEYILEKNNIPVSGTARGRLLLVEYTLRGEKILQKVLIIRNGELLLTVECRSTMNLYYRYSGIFENVMGSVMFSGAENVDRESHISTDTGKKEDQPQAIRKD